MPRKPEVGHDHHAAALGSQQLLHCMLKLNISQKYTEKQERKSNDLMNLIRKILRKYPEFQLVLLLLNVWAELTCIHNYRFP